MSQSSSRSWVQDVFIAHDRQQCELLTILFVTVDLAVFKSSVLRSFVLIYFVRSTSLRKIVNVFCEVQNCCLLVAAKYSIFFTFYHTVQVYIWWRSQSYLMFLSGWTCTFCLQNIFCYSNKRHQNWPPKIFTIHNLVFNYAELE